MKKNFLKLLFSAIGIISSTASITTIALACSKDYVTYINSASCDDVYGETIKLILSINYKIASTDDLIVSINGKYYTKNSLEFKYDNISNRVAFVTFADNKVKSQISIQHNDNAWIQFRNEQVIKINTDNVWELRIDLSMFGGDEKPWSQDFIPESEDFDPKAVKLSEIEYSLKNSIAQKINDVPRDFEKYVRPNDYYIVCVNLSNLRWIDDEKSNLDLTIKGGAKVQLTIFSEKGSVILGNHSQKMTLSFNEWKH